MTEDDWARLAQRMLEIAEAPLFMSTWPHLTVQSLRSAALRLYERNDLRLLIVDYLQSDSTQYCRPAVRSCWRSQPRDQAGRAHDLTTVAPRALEARAALRWLRAANAAPSSRDRALALTPFYVGARIAEMVRLDVDDVRLSARKGTVRLYGKGGSPNSSKRWPPSSGSSPTRPPTPAPPPPPDPRAPPAGRTAPRRQPPYRQPRRNSGQASEPWHQRCPKGALAGLLRRQRRKIRRASARRGLATGCPREVAAGLERP